MSIYSETRDAINEAARSLDSSGKKEFKSSDVQAWIQTQHPDQWLTWKKSWYPHFSYAAKYDPDCSIERVPGTYAYRIALEQPVLDGTSFEASEAVPIAPSPTASPGVPVIKYVQREAKLYEVLRLWLESRGYQARTTATSKKGGTWGNPDVTGIRLDELPIVGGTFECATIEAKLSPQDWKYWFFEAVAHKRFAHRAWFAFAVGTDTPNAEGMKDAEKLREYAEKYRVGVLVVFIALGKYKQLIDGDAESLQITPDDVEVEILWPALFEAVQTPSLNEFLTESLSIRTYQDLQGFGK